MDANEMQHTTDPFAAARAMFEAVVAELGSPAVAGFTHAQLEDWLAEHHREVTRQLLQGPAGPQRRAGGQVSGGDRR
jgi:hypothetical protein